jgi:hypothetical protein
MKLKYFFFLICIAAFTKLNIAQILNSGFEDWETDLDGNYNPVGWQTTNSFPIVTVEPYSPGCQGNYAMTVKTVDVGISFPGIAILETAYNFVQKPTKFFVCVKSNIMAGDQSLIMLALMKGDSAIAAMDSCTFKIDSTINQFTYMEFPIAYISNLMPDSLIIMIASGLLSSQVGTQLTVDEAGFIYGPSDVSDNEKFPEEFELYQNFPNPFNPSTIIKYSIPTSEFVSLIVYDMLGKEVATLVNEEQSAGNYEVDFNAAGLSSGIYFYKLTAGSFVETKKMILMR